MSDTGENEVLIADLKRLAKRRGQQAIIAFCVEPDGTVRCVTYGADRLRCDAAGWWGKGVLDRDVSRVPFQTVFGMGHGGIPTPISDVDADMLDAAYTDDQIPRRFYRAD